MQQTPWDFIPWRFVLLILAHISNICKIVISGKYGHFSCEASFALRGAGTTRFPRRSHGLRLPPSDGSARKGYGLIELRRDEGRGTRDYQKTIFRLAGDGGKFFSAGYRITDAIAENAFSVLI